MKERMYSLDELRQVRGIGPKAIERIKEVGKVMDGVQSYESVFVPSDFYVADEDVNLWQGDTIELMRHIPDKNVDLILADLPYTNSGRNRVTANEWDKDIDLTLLFKEYRRIITDEGAILLFATNPFATELINEAKDLYKYEWVWEKDNGSNFVHVNTQPFKVHEFVLVFGKNPVTYVKSGNNMTYNPQYTYGKPYTVKRDGSDMKNLAGFGGRTDTENKDGRRQPRTVQKVNLERGYHPTQKPTKLLEYLIKTYTHEGQMVLDNTMGSGSTGVACKNTNRRFIGIELDKEYFEIAKERISNV